MCPSSTSSSESSERVVDADGLVLVPEDAASTTARKWLAWTLVGMFLALSAGTGALDTLYPQPLPALIGKEQVEEAARHANARWLDGSRAKLIEHDLKLASFVRAEVTPIYAMAMLSYLNEGGASLLVGRDHWLFLRWRAFPPNFSDEQLSTVSSATLGALQRRLAQLGVRMVVAPIPRKEIIAAEFLPRGVDVRPSLEPRFTEELTRRGVENVDLLGVLKAGGAANMFTKYGSHWTDRAQSIAAERIAQQLGLWTPPEERRTVVIPRTKTRIETDMLNSMGVRSWVPSWFGDDSPQEVFAVIPAHNPRAKPLPPSAARVAIVGTSFTARQQFPKLLQHFMARPVFDGARPAVDAIDAMRVLLTARRNRLLPDILLVEIPLHAIFVTSPFPAAPTLFARLPVAGTAQVMSADGWQIPPAVTAGAIDLRGDWQPIAVVPPNVFGHTGQGVASLALRGSVSGGVMLVQVRHASVVMTYEWPTDRDTLVVPLVAGGPTSFVCGIVGRARDATPTTFHFERGELVALGDGERAANLDCGVPRASDVAWVQELRPTSMEALPRLATLCIDLDMQPRRSGPLDIEVELDTGAPITTRFEALDPRATALVDLAAGVGAHITGVRLHGQGAAITQAATRARILPPSEPLPRAERKGRRAKAK
jgi:hypothetical protein